MLTGTTPALANNHPCSTVNPSVDFNCYADFSVPRDGIRETFCDIWVYTEVTGGICLFPDSNNGPEETGFTCGFTSTNDPSGVVNQDPNVQFGEMDGGPWTAADITGEDGDSVSAASITIHCWIQVNNSAYSHGTAIPTAHCDFTGTGVAGGACQISYTAGPTDNVYLCTQVNMVDDDGSETYQFDEDDNPANGNQCALAISVEF